MQLRFAKMNGTGNRILVIDERAKNRPPPTPEQIKLLACHSTGSSFDQLMWVMPSKAANTAAAYRVFNVDGSEVEQCGNGARCVAWLLARENGGSDTIDLASPAGNIAARINADQSVAVSMGPPEFQLERIPFVADHVAPSYRLHVDGPNFKRRQLDVAVLSMGNPHCVLRVDSVENADVDRLGAAIQRHERFPEGCNVGFMSVRSRTEIDLRVFERSVGETLACGTGACAAIVTAQQTGDVDEQVRVNLPGGQLVVSWRGLGATVWVTGEVELISEGTMDL